MKKSKLWVIILILLVSSGISAGFRDADFAEHMKKLKSKIPHKNFTVIIQKPFVVIGDEPSEIVRYRARNTVLWAVKRLKKMYFQLDPLNIIDIWLFNGEASYRKYAWQIFGDKPDTPFGYASSKHNALVMNIRTGGGTLVHEIVHPFIAANFPSCPSWFNEGLASLYEQCTSKNGKIIGLINWRLPGLLQAIREKKLPSFRTLTSTTEYEFYNQDPGTNYAQARYLCYYLQEKGLLIKFYHQFRNNARNDPSGYETLKKILHIKDLTIFEKKWQNFIQKLRY